LFGCLEYDLARFLNRDVRGLFTRPRTLTWRQVIVWIRHLPSDSALARAGLAGRLTWGIQEHLTASVLDSMRVLTWYYLTAHVGPDDAPQPPTPVRRPGHA
jgi:hypothetical protein